MKYYTFFKAIPSRLARFLDQKEGSTLPFVALTLPVMLGMVGLGADTSMWMADKRELQSAADSAVIAAGWELAQESESYMGSAALREAQNNGYDPDANGVLVLQTVGTSDEGTTISISLEQDADTFFSPIVFKDSVRVGAYAEALVSDVDGEFCILALDEDDAGAVTTQGAATIDSPGCGIAVNSSDDEAFQLSGNVDVTIDSVRITGDYDVSGSVDFVYNSLQTGKSPVTDPYEDLEVPELDGCDANNTRVSSTTTFTPGTFCGGLNISGNNDITFEPGVYIIDGGTFKVTGSGTLTAEGVTFILTGSGNDYADVDISGSRTVEITAPESGEDWSGITFFQDRNAPTRSNLQNKITGTSDLIFDGVAYFPSQGLWFGGDTNVVGSDSPCTKLIARTVTLAGNPRLGNSCDLYDVVETGSPSVKLVY